MTALGQVARVPTSPARRVDSDAGRQPIQDRPYGPLLDGEQPVVGIVVVGGPSVVASRRRHRTELHAIAQRVARVEQRPHLGKAFQCELPIELAGEGAHQRNPLETDQVGQWVLEDRHVRARFLGRSTPSRDRRSVQQGPERAGTAPAGRVLLDRAAVEGDVGVLDEAGRGGEHDEPGLSLPHT